MIQPALLALEDGTVFRGESVGAPGQTVGEVVFNTAMTGYQEILTDPSYCRQIVTLTYPHIGNVGTNTDDAESSRVFAAGLVVRDVPRAYSNWRGERSLRDYLNAHDVVAISGIDTRRLTRLLRDKGAQNGCVMAGETVDESAALVLAREFPGLKGMDLAQEVSARETYEWTEGRWDLFGDGAGYALPPPAAQRWKVVAYDYGIKRNILRMLVSHGANVIIVPARTQADDVLELQPDGVFLSNGPGDPEPCTYAIDAIRALLQTGIPLFGICLGHQLLALAAGARTAKMKFGHHGANHPVRDLQTGSVLITSQNHGFAVDESSLPPEVQASHRSLFDGSLQGIRFTAHPAFGFQGHPEASPGPHDAAGLFASFVGLMEQRRGLVNTIRWPPSGGMHDGPAID